MLYKLLYTEPLDSLDSLLSDIQEASNFGSGPVHLLILTI